MQSDKGEVSAIELA